MAKRKMLDGGAMAVPAAIPRTVAVRPRAVIRRPRAVVPAPITAPTMKKGGKKKRG